MTHEFLSPFWGVSSYEQLLKSRTRRWTNYRNDELLRPQMDEISELAVLQSEAVFSVFFLHRQQWFYPFIPLCEQPPNMAISQPTKGRSSTADEVWLVVDLPSPLKNMSSSVGARFFHISQLGWLIIPKRWKVIKFKFQSTNLWTLEHGLRMLHLNRGFFGWTNIADNFFPHLPSSWAGMKPVFI